MTTRAHILKKLNIHGVNTRNPGGGSIDEEQLCMLDIYGAAGMSAMSAKAWRFGLAVYTKDAYSTREAQVFGIRHIKELGQAEGWTFEKPYRGIVNDWVQSGTISVEDAPKVKAELAALLPVRLFNLCLSELSHSTLCVACNGKRTETETADCRSCSGSGYRGVKMLGIWRRKCASCNGHKQKARLIPCKVCGGKGVRTGSGIEQARIVKMKAATWRKSWSKRYSMIRADFISDLQEFEDYILEKVEDRE